MSLATLKDLISSGAKAARASCHCGRTETLDLPALAAAHSEMMAFMHIRDRLKCKGCGARGQVTTTVEYPFTQPSGQISSHGVSR